MKLHKFFLFFGMLLLPLVGCGSKAPTLKSLELDVKEATLDIGETLMLSTTLEMSDGSDYLGEVTFESSQPTVASVDDAGIVTALLSGTATITVYADNLSDTCLVTVNEDLITVLNLSHEEITFTNVGETLQLNASATHQSGRTYNGTYAWESSEPSVATVTSSGLVTSVGHGSTTITVRADNLSKTCEVIVDLTSDLDVLFEAENHISNQSMFKGNSLAHGGGYAGGIDNCGWGMHFNYYAYVGGTRDIEIYYTTGIENSFHYLYVNGVKGPKVVYSENTGWGSTGFYTPAVVTVSVTLVEGWNTLDLIKDAVQSDTPEWGGYAEIDYIIVKGSGQEVDRTSKTELTTFKYEAEHGVSDQGSNNLPQSHSNASGGYWFGNLDAAGEWVELKVNVPVGRYELAICGGTDHAPVANITTNDSTADNHLTFNSTGGWDQFKMIEDTVEISFTTTGNQSVKITFVSGNWYTLDYFTLTKIA